MIAEDIKDPMTPVSLEGYNEFLSRQKFMFVPIQVMIVQFHARINCINPVPAYCDQ